jgi:hypothetical protein
LEDWLKWLPPAIAALLVGVAGYFVNRLDKRLDEHDRKDDERFGRLDAKIDALRDDAVTKRHAFRSEVHAHVAEVELRLTRDVQRVEAKVDRAAK